MFVRPPGTANKQNDDTDVAQCIGQLGAMDIKGSLITNPLKKPAFGCDAAMRCDHG